VSRLNLGTRDSFSRERSGSSNARLDNSFGKKKYTDDLAGSFRAQRPTMGSGLVSPRRSSKLDLSGSRRKPDRDPFMSSAER
jgi:hypothetical protein